MYHLTPDGEPLRCNAKKGRCPYAQEKHFSTKEEAREAFENEQVSSMMSVSKTIAHKMKLSRATEELLNKLYSKNLKPYVVGGSVRDSLLSGASPKDIDIEVFDAKDMDQLERLLKNSGYRVDSVGKSFGVLKLQLSGGDDIDISLPRRDSKNGEGHRGFEVEVDPTLSMEDAAGRRDFTINALYYSHEDHHVKDPHGGLEDYRRGQLRHINEHFSEDPLRVIRGAQFAARFKMELAPETIKLSQNLRSEFNTLANERLQTEFEKMLTKGDATYGLAALNATGWSKDLRLDKLSPNTGEQANKAIARAKDFHDDRAVFGTAQILLDSEKKDRDFIANYMLTGEKRQRKAQALTKIVSPKATDHRSINAWARNLAKSGLTAKDYYILTGDDVVKKASQNFGSFEAPIPDILTGAKILEHTNQKPGPWMGKLLREAATAQDDEVFTNESSALNWLNRKLKEL